MKTSHAIIIIAVLGAIAAVDLMRQENEQVPPAGEDINRHLSETVDSIAYYSIEKRDYAVARAEKALDNLDARLKQLEEHRKASNETLVAELKAERQKVVKHYDDMKSSTKEEWEATKAAFLKSYHELEDKFRKADEHNNE